MGNLEAINERFKDKEYLKLKLKENGFSGKYLDLVADRLLDTLKNSRTHKLILNKVNTYAVKKIAELLGLHSTIEDYWDKDLKVHFKKITISKRNIPKKINQIKNNQPRIRRKITKRNRFQIRERVISEYIQSKLPKIWNKLDDRGKKILTLFVRNKLLSDGKVYNAKQIKAKLKLCKREEIISYVKEFEHKYEHVKKEVNLFFNEINNLNLKNELNGNFEDFKEGLMIQFFSMKGINETEIKKLANKFKEKLNEKRKLLDFLIKSKNMHCKMCVSNNVNNENVKEIFYSSILGEVIYGVDAELTISIALKESNFKDSFKHHGGGVMQLTTMSSVYILNDKYWLNRVNNISNYKFEYNITSMNLISFNRFSNVMEGVKTIALKMAERNIRKIDGSNIKMIAKYYNGNPNTWEKYSKIVFSKYKELKNIIAYY